MSLSTDSNRVTATGDGVTATFYYNRLLYDATHLQVYVAGVLQTSGYTVNGVPGTATSVTFTAAPAASAQVILLRVVPLTQLSVYQVGGAFPAATTEKNFDLAFMALQQFDEINDRAVTLPVTSTLTAADIPDPADPANYGKGIKIKGDGTGLDTFDMSATPYTSPLTTKGDIATYGTTADRLPVGTNGQVIVADSTTGLGVKWSGDIPDNVLRVVGSADATKKVAFEVDGITTGTTRTVTIPNASGTVAYDTAATTAVAGLIELATQNEVNAMTDTTRALVPNHNTIVLGTPVASTSGTSIDFTGIPDGVRRIVIGISGMSTNGTSDLIVQIGDSGGIETAGYLGANSSIGAGVATTNYTAGFGLNSSVAAATTSHGTATLSLMDSTNFTWAYSSILGQSNAATTSLGSGVKSLSTVLDRVRITTAGGANTFDAGSINVMYER